MKINIEVTKVMKIGKEESRVNIVVNGENTGTSQLFKIPWIENCTEEIRSGITMGRPKVVFRKLSRLLTAEIFPSVSGKIC